MKDNSMKLIISIIAAMFISVMMPMMVFADAPTNYLIQVGGKYVTADMSIDDVSDLFGEPKVTTVSYFGGSAYTFYGNDYSDYLYLETDATGKIVCYGTISEGFTTPTYSYGDVMDNYVRRGTEVTDYNTGALLAEVRYTSGTRFDYNVFFENSYELNRAINIHATDMYNAILHNRGRDERIVFNEEAFQVHQQLAENYTDFGNYCRQTSQSSMYHMTSAGTIYYTNYRWPNPLDVAKNAFTHNAFDGDYAGFIYRWYNDNKNTPYVLQGTVSPELFRDKESVEYTQDEKDKLNLVREWYKKSVKRYNEAVGQEPEGEFLEEPQFDDLPLVAGQPKQDAVIAGVEYLNSIRVGAGLNPVEVDWDMTQGAQHKAVLTMYIGSHGIDNPDPHFPPQPEGVDDDFFNESEIGANGDSRENMFYGNFITSITHALQDHSDGYGCGHRYNLIAKEITKIGLGVADAHAGPYTSQGAHKMGGYAPADVEVIAWPSAGVTPIESGISGEHKLTCEFYNGMTVTDDTVVTVKCLNTGTEWTIDPDDLGANQGFKKIGDTHVGFMDSNITFTAGYVYTFTYTGLKDANGTDAEYSYRSVIEKAYFGDDASEPDDLTLSEDEIYLFEGESKWIKGLITPTSVTDPMITWKSDNDSVATVSKGGMITAEGAGDTVITAKTSNNIFKQVTVHVMHDFDIEDATFDYIDQYQYTGEDIEPDVTVSTDFAELEQGKDYTIEYFDNNEIGQGTIVVYGQGHYTGLKILSFDITGISIAGASVTGIEDAEETGAQITFDLEVSLNGKTLIEGTDYEVNYANNVEAGEATVTITGAGIYTGEIVKTFNIIKRDFTKAVISGVGTMTYTGSEIKLPLVIKYNGDALVEDTDYVTVYENNINKGAAKVTITGIGRYLGSTTKSFYINAASITLADIEWQDTYEATGEVITADPVITFNGKTLVKDTDYVLTGTGQSSIGTGYKMRISGKNNFTGYVDKEYSIVGKSISAAVISGVSDTEYRHEPVMFNDLAVTLDNKTLTEGTDYTVEYSDNEEVGKATVTVTGKGIYLGTVDAAFNIVPIDIASCDVEAIPDATYCGSAVVPESLTITDAYGYTLTAEDNFTFECTNNTNAGVAVVTVTGKDNYSGSKEVMFNIKKLNINNVTVNHIPTQIHTGEPIEPDFTVQGISTDDYTFEYTDNVEIGTGHVVITGKRNCEGTKTVDFQIVASEEEIQLAEDKANAISELQNGWPLDDYDESDRDTITGIKENAEAAINNATTSSEVQEILEDTIELLNAVQTTEQKHVWDEGTVTKPATCSEPGIMTFKCSHCNAERTQEIPVNKDAHSWGVWTEADEENHQRVCANDPSHTETAPHNWDEGTVTKAATCTEDGEKEYKCTVCSATKAETVTKLGHAYGSWENINEEQHQRVCANNPSHTETAPHNWDEGTVTKEATETEEGEILYTCPDCGAELIETIPKKGSDIEPVDPADQMGEDGTPLGPGASDVAADIAIIGQKTDSDPKGTKIYPLLLRTTKQTKTSITLKWSKPSGAAKYVIYGSLCGKGKKYKKLKTQSKTYITLKKAPSKIVKGKYYKFIVVSLDKNNNVVSASKVLHVATKGGKVGNYKSVKTKAKKNRVTVKKGKSFKLAGKGVPASKKLKVKKHIGIRYESSKPAIATVSKKGIIKGVKKGTAYVYAYSQNGKYAKIKVTVK